MGNGVDMDICLIIEEVYLYVVSVNGYYIIVEILINNGKICVMKKFYFI